MFEGKLYNNSHVRAATETGSSCTLVNSNNYVYDDRMNAIDQYHWLQHSHEGLKIASLNVNGIRGHHGELKKLLANTGFHALAMNETKVDNDVSDQIVDIDGYRIERKDRTSRGDGVAVYLGDHLSYTVGRGIVDYGLELICVEIRPLKCRPSIEGSFLP